MANQADGSIVIDTSLDNSGFEKGSEKLLQAINKLTAQIERLGQTINKTFNASAKAGQTAAASTDKVTESAKEATKANQDLADTAAGGFKIFENGELVQDGDKVIETVEGVQEALEETAQADPVSFEQPKQEAAELKAEVEAVQEAAADTNLQDVPRGIGAAIAAVKAKLAGLKPNLKEFAAMALDKGSKVSAVDYDWQKKEIANVQAALDKLYEKQAELDQKGESHNGGKWQRLQADIDRTTLRLVELNDELAEMEKHQISDKVPSIADQKPTPTFSEQVAGKFSAVADTAKQKFWQLSAAMVKFGSGAAGFFAHPLQTINAGLGNLAVKAGTAAGKLGGMVKTGITTGLARISEKAKQAAASLGAMIKTGITSKLKALGKSLLGMGNSAGKSNNGFAAGLKTMMRYGLGIRSLFFLVNRLRSALKDGLGVLARYDGTLNASISSLMGALTQLRNSFAAAFAPIINFVVPALNAMIGAINAAVNAIGMLIARLTGQSYYMKATKAAASFAGANAGTADSAGDAAEALEEEKRQLMGFDDVEVLDDPNKDKSGSGAGGGGGGGGGAGDGGFEKVPLDDSISAFADMLKAAWAKADFTDVGRMIGEKLNKALKKIPWAKIKATMRQIGKSLATFLNGVLATPGLFSTIGKTIAQAINSGFEFAHAFVANFEWDDLGAAIQKGILGFLNHIDWPLILATATGLGSGIGASITSALANNQIWTEGGKFIAAGLNTVVDMAKQFIDNVDWGGIAYGVVTGIASFLGNVDWGQLGGFISSMATGLYNAAAGAIGAINWATLPQRICDAIGQFLAGFDWTATFTAVGNLIGAAASAMVQLGGALWNKLLEVGQNIIDGGLAGVIQALADIGAWIIENVFTPFVEGFKAAFGISSPAKEMKPLGEDIINGVKAGAIKAFTKFGTWIKGLPGKVKQAWDNNIGNKWKTTGQNFVDTVKSGASGVWTNMTGFVNTLPGKVKTAWDNNVGTKWKTTGQNFVNNVKSAASGVWGNMTNFVNTLPGKVKQAWDNNVGNKWTTAGQGIPTGIKAGVNNNAGSATGAVGALPGKLKSAYNNNAGGSTWNSIGKNIAYGIRDGVNAAARYANAAVSSLAESLVKTARSKMVIKSPSRVMRDQVGIYIPEGIAAGIERHASYAIDAVTDLGSDMVRAAENGDNPVLPVDIQAGQMLGGFDAVLGSFADKVAGSFLALVDRLNEIAGQGIPMPVMATGTVSPYQSNAGTGGDFGKVLDAIQRQKDKGVTKGDLQSLLQQVIQAVNGVSFYMGDEQVARHANKGNDKLNRRYKTTD